MPRYDKPLWQIIQDCAAELGPQFTAQEVMARMRREYPGFDERSVRRSLRGMSVNDSTKWRMPGLPPVLFKIDRSTYRRYDPERDGAHDMSESDQLEAEAEELEEPSEETVEFALELHLEEFMTANWPLINFGRPLNLYEDADGQSGRQFRTPVGYIDFLCQDTASGDFVIVELKKGRSSDKVLGQCQRYMGWVKENLASERQGVRGLIIAPEEDERLRFALKVAPNVDMLCYRVDFQLVKPSEAAND